MLSDSNGSPAQQDLERVLRVWADEKEETGDTKGIELVQMLALADFQAGIDPEEPDTCVAVWGDRLAHCDDAEKTARAALSQLDGVTVSSDGEVGSWLRITLD